MRALLSCVLSVCLLLSNMAPAMAQIRAGGRGVSAHGRGRSYHSPRQTKKRSGKTSRKTTVSNSGSTVLSSRVAQTAWHQQQQAAFNHTLSLPTGSLAQHQAFRQDFALAALDQRATGNDVASALQFYRQDLALHGHLVHDLHTTASLNEFLADNIKVVKDRFLDVVTSASSLAALGTQEDAGLLIEFCNQATNSPIAELAQVITARGLLRFGAYDAFNTWVHTIETKGEFWQELSAYVAEEQLPVSFTAQAGETFDKEPLSQWLAKGGELHQLHSDFSRAATHQWLHLDEVNQPSVEVATDLQTPVQQQLASNLRVSLQNPLSQLPGLSTPSSSHRAVEQATPMPRKTSSHASVLYSGVPFFALTDMLGKARQGLRAWKAKRAARRAEEPQVEAPGLHDASQIHTVSADLLDYQSGVASADEAEGLAEKPIVDFAEDGFLLTLDNNGREQVLPVNLTISNRFLNRTWQDFYANHSRTPYNRVVIKPELNLKKGKYVLEMRNQTRKPSTMDHFYFRLQSDQVGRLVHLLKQQGIENFYLKLEASPNTYYKPIEFPVYREGTSEKLPITVTVPADRFKPGSQLVLMSTGELGWIYPGQTKAVAEKEMYVRVPKGHIPEIVEILKPLPTNAPKLNIALRSTQNGAKFISTLTSASNVSLGKTFGPMVRGPLDMSAADADRLMFGINYVLPGLSSLLTPALKKYGEKRIMTISVMLSTAAGVLATAGGFYGFVNGMSLNVVQKGLFLSSLLLMSASSILKQLTTNLLIRANGGEVEYETDVVKDNTKKAEVQTEKSGDLIKRRAKEVFQQSFRPKKYAREHGALTGTEQTQLSHLIRYNLGFIFKNVGTLAFLALPYGINVVGSWFGADLGLDFSVSFPIYAAYSAMLTWRMMHAKLRDAYSAKNIEQSKNAVLKTVDQLVEESLNPNRDAETMDILTRALYDGIDSYVLARQKVDAKLRRKDVYGQAKQAALEVFSERLQKKGVSTQRAQAQVAQTQKDLSKLENLLKNMKGMLKVEGVAPLLTGMTLATVHEFVVSSSFAGTMNNIIPKGDLANFLVAGTLYLPMIAGRIGGNWLSPKISPGSMYMLCSGLSAAGTAMIGLSGGDVPTMITGAAIASLGMGNYYTQMYNYIMEKHKKYRRELSSLLSLTMALGGIGAMFAPGGYTWDMLFAGGLLGISWLTTLPMFASSSFVKAWHGTNIGRKTQANARYTKGKIKQAMHKPQPPQTPNLDDAAPAQ